MNEIVTSIDKEKHMDEYTLALNNIGSVHSKAGNDTSDLCPEDWFAISL